MKNIPTNIAWKYVLYFLEKGYVHSLDYSKISNLKDFHKEKKAIICGNGPSVDIAFLEELSKREDYIIFCANRIHLIYNETEFRPDYVFTSDEQVIKDFGEEIISNNVNKTFIISKKKPLIREDYTWGFILNHRPFRFQDDVLKGFSSGAGSLFPAIQLAYYMGINEMYLYGVDHNFKYTKRKDGMTNGEGNHFIKNYRNNKDWIPPTYDLVEQAFVECDNFLRKNGGMLLNATNGGKLEVLDRISYKDLIIMDK
ncbi:6-hydroxymethylpterin diphosphokinase MptE-like protein [Joostella sp. CR20]|uniref:6-hydroxymethylpterin diphosphokinase MptE-like protein n=1 Tax=Joostella sp. CR20 TaxID=2804312 RepID=UPI00313BF705